MAVSSSTTSESQQECEPDEFVLIYLRDRIEWDGKYTWYDAPQVRPQLTSKCEVLKQAAHLFERQKMEKLKKMLSPLIETRNLNYKSFKYVLDSCFDLLQERKVGSIDSTSSVAIPLLSIIAFSGFYARRLAELDEEYGSRGEWRRDFRKEITQISLYASTSLQAKLKLTFENSEDASPTYSWNKFLNETENWMNQIKIHKNTIAPPMFLAAAAAVFLASGIGVMMLGRRYWHLSTPT